MADEKTPEQLAEEQRLAQQKKDEETKAKQAQKEKDKADAKAKRDADREAKKKAREEEARLKREAREAAKLQKNGVSRPMTGVTKQVWDIADAISAETKQPATRAAVLEQAKAAGLEQGTINTQFGRWRKYHGLTAEREAPKAKQEPEGGAGQEGGTEQ